MKDRNIKKDPLDLLRESYAAVQKRLASRRREAGVEGERIYYADGTAVEQIGTGEDKPKMMVYHGIERQLGNILHEKDEELALSELHRFGKEFMHAVESGSVRELSYYIACGFPVNYQDPATGHTALHRVAAYRARSQLRRLLKTGQCDFLLRDNEGRLASEMAYVFGRDPAVARLLGTKERKQGGAEGVKVTRRPRLA